MADNMVYVGSGSALLVLDAFRGAVIWQAALDSDTHVAPAVGDGAVAVVDGDARVYAFDEADGQRKWSVPVGPGVPIDVVVVDGRVIVAVMSPRGPGRLVALGLSDGEVMWERPVMGQPSRLAVDPTAGQASRMFVGDGNYDVQAIATDGGDVEWVAEDVGHVASWIAEHELVVVWHTSGRIVALHGDDGTQAWEADVAGTPPVYIPRWDRLYTTVSPSRSSVPQVATIDPNDGSRQQRIHVSPPDQPISDVPHPIASDPNGWLMMSTGNSVLTVNPSSGAVAASIRVDEGERLSYGRILGELVNFSPVPVTAGRQIHAVQPPALGHAPLTLSSLDEGQSCPTSPTIERAHGPVLANASPEHDGYELAGPPVTNQGPFDGTVIYDVGKTDQLAAIRGIRMDGDGRVGFRVSASDAFAERLLLDGRARRTSQDRPPHWVIQMHLPSPGCWALQVDGLEDTEAFVFNVDDEQYEQLPDHARASTN